MSKVVDHIYYNVSISSDDNNDSLAYYRAINQSSILNKASDYYLAVSRLYVPLSTVPLMIGEIMPGQTQNDPNKTIYSVTLQYGLNTQQVYLTFTPEDLTLPTPLAPSFNPPNYTQVESEYYFLYNYQTMIEMVNTAFLTAFTALVGTPVGAEEPYLQFDNATQLFSIVCQIANYDMSLPLPIIIYINYQLAELLTGIDFKYTNLSNGRDYMLNVVNLHNNYYQPPDKPIVSPPNYYIFSQYYSTLNQWSNLKGIMVTSNLLPINTEIASRVKSTGNSVSLPILTDFHVIFSSSDTALRSALQYNATLYRLINLKNDSPLVDLDITIYWVSKNNSLYQLKIPFNETVNIKLVFIKKDCIKKYSEVADYEKF